VLWEATTAISLLEAGADIVTLRHPQVINMVKQAIERLMAGTEGQSQG
jgi:CO dehydrogenase/acetyl-CoA synthase delta subunit